MKGLLLVLALFVVVPACASKMPVGIVTPQGQSAYKADAVVQQLQIVADLVTNNTGTQPGNIRPRDAFDIIEWISGDNKHKDAAGNLAPTTGIVQIVQTTSGQGWKAAALLGWNGTIKPIFNRYPALVPYVSVIDGLLQVVL